MDSVPRIEDLHDAPPVEIELVGGYFDGRRMFVPDDRDTWLLPVPPEITGAAGASATTARACSGTSA